MKGALSICFDRRSISPLNAAIRTTAPAIADSAPATAACSACWIATAIGAIQRASAMPASSAARRRAAPAVRTATACSTLARLPACWRANAPDRSWRIAAPSSLCACSAWKIPTVLRRKTPCVVAGAVASAAVATLTARPTQASQLVTALASAARNARATRSARPTKPAIHRRRAAARCRCPLRCPRMPLRPRHERCSCLLDGSGVTYV
jgi:hypothetical protein